MPLRVEKRDGTGERTVLTAMVVSRAVLGPIAARWDGELFPSRWSNLIGGWCVEHHRKYHRAPGRSVEGYFERWVEGGRDEDTTQLVEQYLASLSDEHERLKKECSPDYVLDQAALLFNRAKLARLRESLETDLEVGQVDRGLSRVNEFRKVEIGLGSGIDVLADRAALAAAFEDTQEVLVQYPDALGSFFATALCRDAFISFMGKEKVGKSFWVQDLACRAVEQGRPTAYFECGDNSQSQVLRRFAARLCQRPVKAGSTDCPREFGDPPRNSSIPEVFSDRQVFDRDMAVADTDAAFASLADKVGPDCFRLSCHAAGTVSVHGIEATIESWLRTGWKPPAVIAVDYADILAPVDPRMDKRDRINETWMALRSLSQKYHCLVVTDTQTDADAYTAKVLRRDNFSEDHRKLAHVTGMVGINQTDKEKDAGVYRLNWVVLRELEFAETKCVWTAACLAVGNPAVCSRF